MSRFAWLAVAAALFTAPDALADEQVQPSAPPPAHNAALFADLFTRVNPGGIMLVVGGLYRYRYAHYDTPVLGDPHVQVGASAGVNPLYSQFSVFGEWLPLAILQLGARYDHFVRYGDDSARAYDRFQLNPVLRGKLWKILLLNQVFLSFYQFPRGKEPYEETEYDTYLMPRDLVVQDRTLLLGELWARGRVERLYAGPVYEWTYSRDLDRSRQRVGGAVLWVPAERFGFASRPRLFAMTGINLVDPRHDGEPFLVVGVGADYDLFGAL
ncbi:hypothetical protein LZC95_22335 [Pendulispora brunnea]|uniref:Uncharacterized protein n=1 Tax=Pendulispora brunnea TaxID=2905690 RepID=A0ABZ2KNB6_9BACT